MLPILRQTAMKNIIRNDQLDIDPKQEYLNKQRVTKNTMHSPAALTSPNIFKQNKMAKRDAPASYDEDNYQHRIQVRDIVAVKQVNEKEILEKRS